MSTSIFEGKNIQATILKLGIPAIVGQLATLIYNLVDTYFVSMTNSPEQIAAVTLSTPVLLIIMSISSVFGMGGSSVVARLLGEKSNKSAKSSITFCFYAMTIAGIIVLLAGMLFIEPISRLAGADAENIGYTCDYLKWIFLGAPFIILSNGLVHVFRSTGLIREATVGAILGNAINIVLDWLFIVRLGMGTSGAALATSIGFLCATIYDVICIIRTSVKAEVYSLAPTAMREAEIPAGDIIKIGIPGALITIMLSISNIVLNNSISGYGSDAVAAYGIAYKLDMFPILLTVGFSQGIAPMMGYCFGAKQYDRMNKVVRDTMIDDVIFGAMFTLVFLLFSKPFTMIFLHEESLIGTSALFLRIMCLSAPMLGVINTVTAYYQALGKAINSLFITMLRNIILFIPCVILLNKVLGLNGAIAAQPIVETALAVICFIMYQCSRSKYSIGD